MPYNTMEHKEFMTSDPDFLTPSNKFTVYCTVRLDNYQEVQLLKFLNLHYLGDEDANHIEDGCMVAKYPEKETPEFKNAVDYAKADVMIKLSVEYDVNGNPSFEILEQ